jgi:hypothetical protein
MEGIFGRGTFAKYRCRARRPWLSEEIDPAGCVTTGQRPRELRAVQRGASNLYFPVIESALDIPPWSDQLQQAVGVYWSDIVSVESADDRKVFIGILAKAGLAEILDRLGMTAAQLATAIEERLAGLDDLSGEDLRLEEYRKLTCGIDTPKDDAQEFEIRNVVVPERLKNVVGRLVRVTRLREVRALTGFTRIYPPGADASSDKAPISSARMRWLPAIEVRGEGVFVTLRADALTEWEQREQVQDRVRALRVSAENDWKDRYGDVPFPVPLTPRFILIHVLAHAVIRELTLECGYSTASLRERLYVSEGDAGMAGVLVYTSTPDSDGTLGGLERQGLAKRFNRVFVRALRAMEWCSSDPLCSEGVIGGLDSFSLAACHACCLLPETACEHYNRYLDRALLAGTPGKPGVGFFRTLLQEQYDGADVASTDPA